MSLTPIRKTFKYGEHTVHLETGEVARQATGSVLVSMEDTVVLATVVARQEAKSGQDFFPLTVDYQEKTYAAGKIPGGFFKREGRPSEKEVLTSRLIDRPIRPLFPDGFYNEVQVVLHVMSINPEIDPDIPALIGASAALSLSGIPFKGPIGAARVGYVDGQLVVNPTASQLKNSALNLVVAGTERAVLMVESEADQLPEDVMLGAVLFGHQQMQLAIDAIHSLVREAGKPAWDWQSAPKNEVLLSRIVNLAGSDVRAAYQIRSKQARSQRISEIEAQTASTLITEATETGNAPPDPNEVGAILFDLQAKLVRSQILDGEPRIDGRDTRTVRPIEIRLGVLPRTHGSALFTRGETQAVVTATLGTKQDEQIIDALQGEYRERFMLHYNMPPFATGETGRMGAPKRREVGHGRLAKRALAAVLPPVEEFQYSIRVVSEITESNGSSSMASVCGGCLALMDAGVPLKAHVAGIAMGLIKDGNRFAVLSDILGDEDHVGDMDFKVAGTDKGVTALQMDIKIKGVSLEVMRQALGNAREARMIVLAKMREALEKPRPELSPYAPRFVTIKIRTEKIREIIGPGGKVIRGIQEQTGTKIDVEDDGRVTVFAPDSAAVQKAVAIIQDICREVELDRIYLGKVKKIVEFGAFVEVIPNTEGLLHISQIAENRIRTVQDVLTEGDEVLVKVIEIDGNGKMRLSRKIALRDQPALADKEKLKNPNAANPPRA